MDPMTLSAGFSALGAAAAGGPSSVQSDNLFDNSGWNVNFGTGSIDSNRSQAEGAGAALPQSINGYLPYVLVAAGLLIAWRMTRR